MHVLFMNFYQRKLPHWQPEGAQYFITFRLKGSLPRKVIEELRNLRKQLRHRQESDESFDRQTIQRKIFVKFEVVLDAGNEGPTWLKNRKVAELVQEAIHYRDTKKYDLFAYCIMSNHVHLVFQHLSNTSSLEPTNNFPITEIMQELKRYTAYESNKILGREGAFWQSESFDRVIRDQNELGKTIRYTLNNPVKAGLVSHWQEWPYTYCKPEFIANFNDS